MWSFTWMRMVGLIVGALYHDQTMTNVVLTLCSAFQYAYLKSHQTTSWLLTLMTELSAHTSLKIFDWSPTAAWIFWPVFTSHNCKPLPFEDNTCSPPQSAMAHVSADPSPMLTIGSSFSSPSRSWDHSSQDREPRDHNCTSLAAVITVSSSSHCTAVTVLSCGRI